MIKKNKFLFNICFIIIFIGLTGCNSHVVVDKNQEILETAIQEIEVTTQHPIDNTVQAQESDTDLTQPSNIGQSVGSELIDYSQYLNKVWIFEDWNSDFAYNDNEYCSFVITKIENGFIEGELEPRKLISSMRNYSQPGYSVYSGKLIGKIDGDIAECQFSDDSGNSGIVTLKFSDNDRIDVNIKYEHINSIYENQQLNGSYRVRPYTINDKKDFVVDESLSFSIELNSWGYVNFVAGIRLGNKQIPDVFFTNENQDILYEFDRAYPTASHILDVKASDLNTDGLIDVEIITYFPDVPIAYNLKWVFYQMENGLFQGEPPESVEETFPITEDSILFVTELQDQLRERFGEDSKISYIPDVYEQDSGLWHYGFSIDTR